jgi:C-methyltransferase
MRGKERFSAPGGLSVPICALALVAAKKREILQNIRRVIPPGGTLLLVESLVDSNARPAGLVDMLMLAIGGRERTEADLRSLLASTRFALTRIIATEASSVVECHPV